MLCTTFICLRVALFLDFVSNGLTKSVISANLIKLKTWQLNHSLSAYNNIKAYIFVIGIDSVHLLPLVQTDF